jgi:hypothetical protein
MEWMQSQQEVCPVLKQQRFWKQLPHPEDHQDHHQGRHHADLAGPTLFLSADTLPLNVVNQCLCTVVLLVVVVFSKTSSTS